MYSFTKSTVTHLTDEHDPHDPCDETDDTLCVEAVDPTLLRDGVLGTCPTPTTVGVMNEAFAWILIDGPKSDLTCEMFC